MRGSAGGGVLLPKVSGNQRLAPGLWAGSSCSPEAFLAAPLFPETILARRGMPRTALPNKRCAPRLLLLSCAGGSWAEPGGARAHGRELERLPLPHCPRCPRVQATGLHEEGSGLEAALHSSVLWWFQHCRSVPDPLRPSPWVLRDLQERCFAFSGCGGRESPRPGPEHALCLVCAGLGPRAGGGRSRIPPFNNFCLFAQNAGEWSGEERGPLR